MWNLEEMKKDFKKVEFVSQKDGYTQYIPIRIVVLLGPLSRIKEDGSLDDTIISIKDSKTIKLFKKHFRNLFLESY